MQPVIVDDFLDVPGEKLLEDPEIRAEFEKLAGSDPELKTDPARRRMFYLKKSPYADPNLNIFPIYRLPDKVTISANLVE